MEDRPSPRKRAKLENSPESCYRSASQPSDLFPWYNSKKDSDYLTWVSDLVSTNRHKTFDLERPPGATVTIGDLEDTIYSEEEDELNAWGKFYLPEIVNMQVLGVVEGTSCTHDQLVVMTCEDRQLYAYDGEKLHLVSSSLRQLHYKGIEYPAPKRYYNGEAFKHMTEEDWAKVRQRMDQEHHELVMSKKSEFLENLTLLKQNIELRGICMSLDCGRKPNNTHTVYAKSTQKLRKPNKTHTVYAKSTQKLRKPNKTHTVYAKSTQKGPKPGSNPVSFYSVKSSPTTQRRRHLQAHRIKLVEFRVPEGHQLL